MKANVHIAKNQIEAIKGGGPFHGHELRLTIGLIVKNEEKTLDKCLSSLSPLLNAVPSELIITDTGSTDRTVEVAQKYTDHIIHFEWCDDFSAARNTGLDAARGEWFLYLDGDEWFDDVTELVDFFNSGECDRYGSAAYIQRNYKDLLGENQSDDYVCRVFRIYPDSQFRNKIHEDFLLPPPTKILDTFVHHYGYVFRSVEEAESKKNRNRVLLEKELEADPTDIKALFQLSGQLIGEDDEQAEIYAKRGLEAAYSKKKDLEPHTCIRMARALIDAYFDDKRYDEVLKLIPEVLEDETGQGVFHLEFYRIGQMAAYQLKQYETAVEYGNLYLGLYPAYERKEMDISGLIFGFFNFLTPQSREDCLVMNGKAFLKLKKPEEAQKCLDSLELSLPNSTRDGSLPLCFSIADKLGNWSLTVKFYGRMLLLGDDGKICDFIEYANGYCAIYPSKREAVMRAFADTEGENAWYLLCRLRLAEDADDRKQSTMLLESLCRSDGSWGAGYADILWYVMREKLNFVPFLSHVEADSLLPMTFEMRKRHADYVEVIADYFTVFSFEGAKALLFSTCLLERTVFAGAREMGKDRYRKLVRFYFENLSKFVRAVYKPEILATAGLLALPRVYRFGYYAGLALNAKRKGDGVGYLENLRTGLKEYPVMRNCINFLLRDFEEEQKEHAVKAEEFSVLAKQVKQNIQQLIAQGDLKQAGVYTLQLAKLIPEDDDVRRYRKLTHTEPTMTELASGLPQ